MGVPLPNLFAGTEIAEWRMMEAAASIYMDPSTSSIGKYASLALLLPLSTLIGFGMGYGLDHLFHTGWIRYVFIVLGTVSGFISLIRELDKDK
jgi:F0F1-type ATP synthase assembly protein I